MHIEPIAPNLPVIQDWPDVTEGESGRPRRGQDRHRCQHILANARFSARFVPVWACGSEDMSLDDPPVGAARGYTARPVILSTGIRTTTRTAPGRSAAGSLPSYFQDSCVSTRRPTSGVIDTRPRSSA